LVKIEATALNPVDWKVQKSGVFVEEWPCVLGEDSAGTVAAVGKGVAGFAVGDKVVHQGWFTNDQAAFQQYTIVPAEITAKVPSNISFDEAASIPLALATAALGLYGAAVTQGQGGLGLTPPWEDAGRDKYAGKPILVFGGASSVGQIAIQLAKLSGFSPIIATASLKHTSLLKSLGVDHVIDRSVPLSELKAQLESLAKAPIEVVYDAVSFPETQRAGYSVLAPGGSILIVQGPQIKIDAAADKTIAHVFGNVNTPSNRAAGVGLYKKLTSLLEKGELKPNRVEVLPNGLAGIPDGLKRMELGQISGQKLIARPQETA